jgi:intracellular septation protein A
MSLVLPVTAVLLGLRLLGELVLSALNRAEVRRHASAAPPAVAAIMDEATYAKSVAYTLAKSRLGVVSGVFDTVVLAIVLFGGATLVFHDDTFIKWKPTVLYWLMGGALALGHLVLKRNFLQSLMGSQLELPAPVWLRLLWAWAGFFVFMGVVNLWVAFNFDLDTWVSYKLFGGMGLMLVFVVIQALYLSRFIKADEAAPEETP